ncbi:hypothetical protein OKW35_002894 [Paraburkholderia sp. MM5477-R1]
MPDRVEGYANSPPVNEGELKEFDCIRPGFAFRAAAFMDGLCLREDGTCKRIHDTR